MVPRTYPPFHLWFRTIAIAYNPRTSKITRIALDPINGQTMTINGDTTYDEWMDRLKENYSDQEIELQKKKIKNAAKDNADYRSLKRVLGKRNVPKTLDEYQNIKYNKSSEWESLKDHYFVKSRLEDGRYGSIINPEMQAPHMQSTATKGKSFFYDHIDAQQLFDKYAGTGVVEINSKGRTNKETIMTDSVLGIDYRTGSEVKGFKIHHSAKRTHLVPWKGES